MVSANHILFPLKANDFNSNIIIILNFRGIDENHQDGQEDNHTVRFQEHMLEDSLARPTSHKQRDRVFRSPNRITRCLGNGRHHPRCYEAAASKAGSNSWSKKLAVGCLNN